MSWLSRMFGRSDLERGDDLPADFRLPRHANEKVEETGLPTFRPSRGRSLLLGEKIDASSAKALLRDAFTPSQPVVRPEMFAGRRELLGELIAAVEDQRLHFVLYGDRGIGKTSILRILAGQARRAGYLVCYISCGEGFAFTDFARRVAQRIPLLHHEDFEPGSPEIERGMALSDVLPKEGVIDVSLFGEQLSKIRDTQLIIMLDEFDRARSQEFRSSIAELIKNLSDNAAPVQVLIAGVAADLSELIAQIPSIRRNVRGVVVPNMSDAEVGEMLDKAEQKSRLTFNGDARELINLAALGLPYLVGLIAQSASLLAIERGELTVTKPDVREAIRRVRNDMGSRISAPTRHAIAKATEDDRLLEFGKLAHVALRSGGLLPGHAISEDLRRAEDAPNNPLALVEPLEDDPLDRWRFRDDGGAIFIWLSAVAPN